MYKYNKITIWNQVFCSYLLKNQSFEGLDHLPLLVNTPLNIIYINMILSIYYFVLNIIMSRNRFVCITFSAPTKLVNHVVPYPASVACYHHFITKPMVTTELLVITRFILFLILFTLHTFTQLFYKWNWLREH
jgi:hypothetical protein